MTEDNWKELATTQSELIEDLIKMASKALPYNIALSGVNGFIVRHIVLEKQLEKLVDVSKEADEFQKLLSSFPPGTPHCECHGTGLIPLSSFKPMWKEGDPYGDNMKVGEIYGAEIVGPMATSSQGMYNPVDIPTIKD